MRQKYAYTVNILLKKTLIRRGFFIKKEWFKQLFNASTLKKKYINRLIEKKCSLQTRIRQLRIRFVSYNTQFYPIWIALL